MKKIYIVLIGLFVLSIVHSVNYAQSATTPLPVGGIAAIMKNVVYPAEAKKLDIQGRVIAKAIVDEKGDVEKVEILKSVDELFNKAVIDAVLKTKFVPGKLEDGTPVKSSVVIPVNFRLK